MPGPVISEPVVTKKTIGSANKIIIGPLVETLKREVKPEKLYSALVKMNEDLNKTYNALFDGPLPAVDGFGLTRINAAVLNGIIPASYNIAYTDVNNLFSHGQRIFWDDADEPLLTLAFANQVSDPIVESATFLRIGASAEDTYYITQGTTWDHTVDDVAFGAVGFYISGGVIDVSWYDAAVNNFRRTFQFNGREFVGQNFAISDNVSLMRIDDNDVVRLGDSALADGTPSGYPAIPFTVPANLPSSGNADCDGVIAINKTTPRLIFYVNGLRYFVNGTAF